MREHYKKLPNIPPQCRIAPKYSDKTANGLTNCIVSWLKLSGNFAERTGNTGRLIENRTTFVDCVGIPRVIGSSKWIKGSGTRGTSDVKALIAGKSVAIEIKIGADRQSEKQKEYQRQIEAAGGIYIIARTFDEFLQWYDKFMEEVCYGK